MSEDRAAPLRPAPPGAALEPEQDTRGALSRLVEVLLDKGVYLDLDLLVTVAEVPLIAVDVRAVLAGVETMIEYGIPGPWSEYDVARSRQPVPVPGTVAEQADAWYLEARAGGAVWREGVLSLERAGALRWQGHGDRRASLRLVPTQVAGARVVGGADAPVGDRALELKTDSGTVQLASGDPERWLALIRDFADPAGTGGEVE